MSNEKKNTTLKTILELTEKIEKLERMLTIANRMKDDEAIKELTSILISINEYVDSLIK